MGNRIPANLLLYMILKKEKKIDSSTFRALFTHAHQLNQKKCLILIFNTIYENT